MEDTRKKERPIDRLIIFAGYAQTELKVVKGLTSFEHYCNLANGYILSNKNRGGSKGNIGSDMMARISKAFPMLNLKWLCSGEGDMIDDIAKLQQEIIYLKRKLATIKNIATNE